MRHAARLASVIVGLAGLAWFISFAIGRASALQSAERTIAEQKQANAALVEAHVREVRRTTDSLRTVFANAERQRQVQLRHADTALVRTGRTVDSLRAILADTATLVPRAIAEDALAQYDSLALAFREYLRVDAVVHQAIADERKAWQVERTAADSALAAWKASSVAWQEAATCRVFGMPCPTRTQAFIGGGLTVLAAVLVVR